MEKITHEQFKQQTESIPDNELLQMAHKELSELCKNGGRSFHMTVPPRTTDTDIIFSEVLRRFEILSFVTEGGVVLKNVAQTELQSTEPRALVIHNVSGSLPRCDYRKSGCVNDGEIINGVWVCKNHKRQ